MTLFGKFLPNLHHIFFFFGERVEGFLVQEPHGPRALRGNGQGLGPGRTLVVETPGSDGPTRIGRMVLLRPPLC